MRAIDKVVISTTVLLISSIMTGCATFKPPDQDYKYTSSMHWFTGPDGNIFVVDIIRYDLDGDSFRGLKLISASPQNKKLTVFNYEAKGSSWEPFATSRPDSLNTERPMIGRGENWIAASVNVSNFKAHEGSGIKRVSFDLSLEPKSKSLTTGALGATLVNMNGEDFIRVRTQGTLQIDGTVYEIDSIGPTSIHFGEYLPEYNTVGNIHDLNNSSNLNVLITSFRYDNLKLGGELLGDKALSYAIIDDEFILPRIGIKKPEPRKIHLGNGYIEIQEIFTSVPHLLQGIRTVTVLAKARWINKDGESKELGLVVIDSRGDYFIDNLNLSIER